MNKIASVITAILITLISFASCSRNEAEEVAVSCSGVTVSYTTDVSPIIQNYCATTSSCHGTGSHESPGALTTYSQIYSARYSIRSAVANGSMPRDRTLTTEQKTAIICWIENGAANN